MTEDLTAFLTARLDEDEAAARAAGGRTWCQPDPEHTPGWVEDDSGSLDRIVTHDDGTPTGEQAAHIARHDPARALREVEAKRAIIRAAFAHEATIDGEWGCCHEAGEIAAGQCPDIQPDDIGILRILAAAYSDHGDYDATWRPATEAPAQEPRDPT